MSITHVGASVAQGRGFGAVRARIAHWLSERRLRRDISAVEGFDDALLRDIGVSRSEIEDTVRHGRGRR